jgi:hypothetical protein
MSSSERAFLSGRFRADEPVELAGNVAFQAADDLASGLALGDASGVVLCAGVPSESTQNDPVKSGVRLPITTAVEATTVRLSG